MFDPKKSGEEADKLIAELNQGEETPVEDQTAEEATIPTETPTVEGGDETDGTLSTEVAVQPDTTVPEIVPESVDTQLADMRKLLDTSEQRWKVAQGMIEKKDSELEDMRALFAKLADDKARAPVEEAPAQPQSTVTAEDIEQFSPELYAFIGKVASDTARQMIADSSQSFDASISTLQDSVNTVTETNTQTTQQLFDQRLTAEVGNWESINTDPGFIAWLQEVDPFSGRAKLELLQASYAALDVGTTANFFKAYEGSIAPAPVEKIAPAPRPTAAEFVSPGKSKASAAAPQKEGKLWSRSDISKLYDDKMKKRISQKNFDEQERDLFAAQSEDRIVA